MKTHQAKHTTFFTTFASLAFAGLFITATPSALAQPVEKKIEMSKAREIDFHVESVDGKTHWMPASVVVKPGEALTLVFHHDVKTGPDFHGVDIPELKVKGQVNRGKEARFNVAIPKNFKEKEITIKCQFHPAHQPAVLKVEAAKPAK